MVYKVDKKLIVLTSLLLLTSLFFTFSVYLSDMGKIGVIVCLVVVGFILFNLIVLLSKKVEVDGDVISQTTIYGKKSVNINEIEDIGVVKLRWRIILIVSDPYKFVFISSLYDDFEKFVDGLKTALNNQLENLLEPVTHKSISKKRKFLWLMVVAANVFFIVSGVYNILYR